jgi:3-methyladenine DNA glycosylase AlkD
VSDSRGISDSNEYPLAEPPTRAPRAQEDRFLGRGEVRGAVAKLGLVKRSIAAELAARISSELRRLGRPERAEASKRYLKSELEFLGVDTKTMRAAVRRALKTAAPLERAGLLALVRALWSSGVFELRAVAVEALAMQGPLLRKTDIAVVERLLRASHTWALVDFLAVHVAGPLVIRFPELGSTLDRWATDPDFWLRRAAMLALLLPLRRGEGDFGRFARYAEAMLGEKEFFIRKAIGWVLRETGKRRPELVDAWLHGRILRASGVTVREAVRYLPKGRRDALLEAYREGRPTGLRETRRSA